MVQQEILREKSKKPKEQDEQPQEQPGFFRRIGNAIASRFRR